MAVYFVEVLMKALMLIVILATVGYHNSFFGKIQDADSDGVPDLPNVRDSHSKCYTGANRFFGFLAAPWYYFGIIVYYISYPAIWAARSFNNGHRWLIAVHHGKISRIPSNGASLAKAK